MCVVAGLEGFKAIAQIPAVVSRRCGVCPSAPFSTRAQLSSPGQLLCGLSSSMSYIPTTLALAHPPAPARSLVCPPPSITLHIGCPRSS